MFRRILFLLLVVGSLPLVKRFCYKRTEGFSPHKIQSSLPFNSDWEVELLPENERSAVLKTLDQPYFYLAKGAQSFVFVSEDGESVIKFFRLNHLLPPFWVSQLQFPPFLQAFQLRKWLQKREELRKDFQSYVIAYDQLRDETGLLYLHLNKTKHLDKELILYDKLNIAHRICLDDMEFLVQKRAQLVYPAIDALVQKGEISKAKEAISALVRLLAVRCERGIFDKDPDLNTNFGFIGQKPLQIDIGRFRPREEKGTEENYRDEIIRTTDHFRQWLDQSCPPLSEHLMHEIHELESEI